MSEAEILRLSALIADKAEGMRAMGYSDREALECAAIDGLLCGESEEFRGAWRADQ